VQRGQLQDARMHLDAALAAAGTAGSKLNEARILNALAICAVSAGHYDEAVERYAQARERFRALGGRRGEAMTMSNLAEANIKCGNDAAAAEWARQGHALALDLGEQEVQALCLHTLGASLAATGNLSEAARYFLDALSLCESLDLNYALCDVLASLARTFRRMGEPLRAIDYCERSLALRRNMGDRPGQIEALVELGLSLADLDQGSRASACLTEAEILLDRLDADPGDLAERLSRATAAIGR
jgi:tetratricopeptide (TPR) repeat protein